MISPERYLQRERRSEIRHEFLAGYVHAAAPNTADHNHIVGNISGELHSALRGKSCEAFALGMLLRIAKENVFYYPDAFVVCDPTDKAKYFRERPSIVFEVLSPETERIDQNEKRKAYAAIDSLKVYALVAQDRFETTLLRRTGEGGWTTEVLRGRDAVLKLPEIGIEIPFERIYERTSLLTNQPG